MKTFIVTGYSGKMDGFLMVVDAETELEALQQLNTHGRKLVTIHDVSIDLTNHYLTAEWRSDNVASIIEDTKRDEAPRWYWQIFIQELEKNKNLDEAVCW